MTVGSNIATLSAGETKLAARSVQNHGPNTVMGVLVDACGQ
jgi:hypothetical protein